MSGRIQVIGAHSADFVWRAGGAIAKAVEAGGRAEVVALSYGERGALMERAFTTPYTGKCDWEQVFAASRAVGPERTVWSTDLGQVFNPPVEDGLAIMADRFLEAGFRDEEVRTMAVENTRWIAAANSSAGERAAAA